MAAYQKPRNGIRNVNDDGTGSGLADAPIDGQTYGRLNGAWADLAGLYLTEAPSDGLYYSRRNAAWTAILPFTEAPIDGNYYVRRNGAWTIQPKPIAADAPSDGTKYVRQNGAWVAETAASAAPSYTAYGAAIMKIDPLQLFLARAAGLPQPFLFLYEGVMPGYLLAANTAGAVGPYFTTTGGGNGTLVCNTIGTYLVECHFDYQYNIGSAGTAYLSGLWLYFALLHTPFGLGATNIASQDMLYVPYTVSRPYAFSGQSFTCTVQLGVGDSITPIVYLAEQPSPPPIIVGLTLNSSNTFTVIKIA